MWSLKHIKLKFLMLRGVKEKWVKKIREKKRNEGALNN